MDSRGTKVAGPALDEPTLDALAVSIDVFAARCRSRVYAEEGIPAMLVVEDLRLDHHRPERRRTGTEQDVLLATALDLYGRLTCRREETPGAADLATALEMLATRWFFATPLPDLPPASPSRAR